MNRRPRHPVLAAALFLGACAGTDGPDYVRPDLPLPASMPGATGAREGAPALRWWTALGSPELDAIVEKSRATNFDLVATEARIRAARAAARRAGSPAAPTLDVGGSYTRSRPSENSVSGAAAQFGNVADPSDVLTFSGDAGWEPDFFGRVRRGVEAAQADADAIEEDRRAMEVALAGDIADAWLDVGEADAEIAIHRETVGLLEQTLGLVRTRVDAGLVSELDLRRTEGDLAAARSRIPAPERRRTVAENRLALLVGEAPGLRVTGRAPAAITLPGEIRVGVPGTLLELRPDVRAAERRLVATNARVGEAIADFYPRIRIVGRLGFSSIEPNDILQWGSRIWSFAPSVTLPILDGGEREFRRIEAEARKDEAVAAWTGAVLRALNEVADAMVSLSASRRTVEAVRATVTAGQRSVELATVRYREGITSYLEVLDAQRALAASRLELLQAERSVLTEYVRLHRALGGGWNGSEHAIEAPPADGPTER